MTNKSKQHLTPGEPEQLASEIINDFNTSGAYQRGRLARLIELAIGNDQAAAAFFRSFVERLADSFEPAAITLYNQAFAHLIQCCRSSDGGHALDQRLKSFGLVTEADLIARVETLRNRQTQCWPGDARFLRRVVVLSRVTLGADVAITSVIIERAKREFPDAEIALVGGRKAAELFGGDPRLSFKEIGYNRTGNVIEKLSSWIDVFDSVKEAAEGLDTGEVLVIDPDSRLTQLGLLPVTYDNQSFTDYLFFPSREYGSDTNRSLGQLTSLWLDGVFNRRDQIYPRVTLRHADTNRASELIKRARQSSDRPVATINFGVGENPAKRAGDEFETLLVARLIADGVTVILDKGAGQDESRRANRIIENAKQVIVDGRPARAIEVNEEALEYYLSIDALDQNLLVWNGRIGILAALISQSDIYIGYDSAGQHIAAALGVPSVEVFAGHSSIRMLDRWRPAGPAESRIVVVDSQGSNKDNILSDALLYARELLSR